MLHAAQERAREGATEVVPGSNNQWWAHAPHFHGTEGGAVGTPLIEDHDEDAILGRNTHALSAEGRSSIPAESDAPPTTTTAATSTEIDTVLKVPALQQSSRAENAEEPEPKRRSLRRSDEATTGDGGRRPRGQPTPEQRMLAKRHLLRRSWQPPRPMWDPKISYMRVGMEAGSDKDTACATFLYFVFNDYC